MAMRQLWVLACVAGCGGTESSLLDFVEADADLARPIHITGHSRHELWSVVDRPGGDEAMIAFTQNRGESWKRFAVPSIRGSEPVQLAADGKGLAWITGTGMDGAPVLASVRVIGDQATIEDFSSVFPPGTTEVTLHLGGLDPDPMITARVAAAPTLSLFLLDELRPIPSWYRHPMTDVISLVGVYGVDAGYFLKATAGIPTLIYCSLPDGSAHCFEVPPWTDGNDRILPSTPTPDNDWLWRADSLGGELVHRIGGGFDVRRVEGWPDSALVPIRFLAVETGELGVLASRTGSLVWVTLDAQTRVTRETTLGEYTGDIDPESVTMLPDTTLVIPTADGWYRGDVRGL